MQTVPTPGATRSGVFSFIFNAAPAKRHRTKSLSLKGKAFGAVLG